jgi:UPF0042 nucleotide-binding protein
MTSEKRLLIFVSGLSGAGKTTALSILNDMNYHSVDNLPIDMIDTYLNHLPCDNKPIALGIGVRSIDFCVKTVLDKIDALKSHYEVRLLFLQSNSKTIHKRYSLTGMTHPLCDDGNLEKAITAEYQIYTPLIEVASLVIDTDDIGPKDLRRKLMTAYEKSITTKRPLFVITSFGFKYGIPQDAETIFDARILKNPHWHKELAVLTGQDKAVQEFLESDNNTHIFLNQVTHYLMQAVIPFVTTDRSFYHIAIGCTGGKHRSVYSAEKIYQFLKDNNIYCRLEHKILE